MASFPTSWVIETGGYRTAPPRSPTTIPSSPPLTPPRHQPNEINQGPCTSLNPYLTSSFASGDLDKPPSSTRQGRTTTPGQYSASFPSSWLLKTSSPTASQSNTITLRPRVGNSRSPFTSHLSVPTSVMSSTVVSSQSLARATRPASTAPTKQQTEGLETVPHNQGNLYSEGMGTDGRASTGTKDKREETSAWLESLAQTSSELEQQQKQQGESLLSASSNPDVDEEVAVGFDDGLSVFSGLGDAPHDPPEVLGTYSYAGSVYTGSVTRRI